MRPRLGRSNRSMKIEHRRPDTKMCAEGRTGGEFYPATLTMLGMRVAPPPLSSASVAGAEAVRWRLVGSLVGLPPHDVGTHIERVDITLRSVVFVLHNKQMCKAASGCECCVPQPSLLLPSAIDSTVPGYECMGNNSLGTAISVNMAK